LFYGYYKFINDLTPHPNRKIFFCIWDHFWPLLST
jgi:hypothetical protein